MASRLFFALLAALILKCSADRYYYTPQNGTNEAWKTRMQTLKPGDILQFAAGTYTVTSKLSVSWIGNITHPIIIEGEAGAQTTIYRPDANQNTIDIGTGSYFILQNLRFQGGSKGVRMGESGNIENAIFQNLEIFDTTTTAMSANDVGRTHTNVTIRHNEIHDTGSSESECFYFGCNNAGCTFRNSLIEYNYCHNTAGESGSGGSGIQVKTGSYNNIVRNNVVTDILYGAGILLYDDYDLGVNLIEGNYVARTGDNGIQVTSGAKIINNVITDCGGLCISVQANQPKSGSPLRNVFMAHNTAISDSGSKCVKVESTSATSFSVINNAVFCNNPEPYYLLFSGGTINNNGYYGEGSDPIGTNSVALGTQNAELLNPAGLNYYPKAGSKLLNAGASLSSVSSDFNCNARSGTTPTLGAYEYVGASNSGWQIADDFKPTCGSSTPPPAPVTTRSPTTKPLTTRAVTSGMITTRPITSSPVTSRSVTSSPLTTRPVTSSPLTTNAVTSGTIPVTSGFITTRSVTSAPITSASVTSAPVTSSPLTTRPVTSASVVTTRAITSGREITSGGATSRSVTSGPVTSRDLTSSPLTTRSITSGGVTTRVAPLTTRAAAPLTTNAAAPLTTNAASPVTTKALTTKPLTTKSLTTNPLTTSPLTTSPATTGEEVPITTGESEPSSTTGESEPSSTTEEISTAAPPGWDGRCQNDRDCYGNSICSIELGYCVCRPDEIVEDGNCVMPEDSLSFASKLGTFYTLFYSLVLFILYF
eukprot:TRINITY_DN2548_c0_g1_i1.p1 TRINITY_DN2548_c0_g1~~TRINITY_DN2548_c0_g1_i1.p1  ORF type:complete len:763 (+),score=140.99 TRINITY_DN2548_c0_g1_i1:51-2339(+)